MKKSKVVVLALCNPVADLFSRYPSIVMKPQTGEIPLGLLYVAAALERSGFEVVVIDNTVEHLTKEELAEKVLSFSPIIVGFSLLVLNVVNTRDVAKRVKDLSPETIVIFGGPHATIMPQKQAEYSFVDVVITHQGEMTLSNIARKVECGEFDRQKEPSLKIIKGECIDKLDELPLPARHLIDISMYKRKSYVLDIEPVDYLCSSRGCPFNCSFCSSKTVWGRRYYKRSASSVVDEIEYLLTHYASKGFFFREDNFTANKKHVLDICKEIKRRTLNIQWECESRVDTINRKTLESMKEAGCSAIWCGVESGSQRTLDRIRKGFSLEQVRNFCTSCKDVGIDVGACFMIGFPSETITDIEETYNFALGLPVKWVQFATYVGFPGSEIYEEIVRKKLWYNKWEDVLVARNEYLSSSQLFDLESAMNNDANIQFDLAKENKEQNISVYKEIIAKMLIKLPKIYLLFENPKLFMTKLLGYFRRVNKSYGTGSENKLSAPQLFKQLDRTNKT